MSAILLERPPDMERNASECPHVEVDALGSNRNAKFLRCRACGRILVLQGARAWVIQPPAVPAPPG